MSSVILYITQYEQQGVGIQWSNVYVSAVKEERFNFGYACMFIVFDSIMYGTVGLVVLMIKNSGNKEKVGQGCQSFWSKVANCWLISVDIGKEESPSVSSDNTSELENESNNPMNASKSDF